MATTSLQKMRKRAEKAEGIAIGMGFLLLKIKAKHGAEFGIGMAQQVDQAIADYRALVEAKQRREAMAARQREAQAPTGGALRGNVRGNADPTAA